MGLTLWVCSPSARPAARLRVAMTHVEHPSVSRTAFEELHDQLRRDPPGALGSLAEEDLRHLAEAIRAARVRQAAALERAAEQGFSYVPRLLRGPIRRIVG
jgi:hypothetical protein